MNCLRTRPAARLRCPPTFSPSITACISAATWDMRIIQPVWTRGAKTKTTVKIGALTQGALPPLPPLPLDGFSDPPILKAYPKVIQQHLDNVLKFQDCVVLTRVGDFYEMYGDQVDEYASLINLKKARRATVQGDVSMAGFQYTQLDRYLKMFVLELGKKVAISEQIRIPQELRSSKAGAPMYDRKVTRVVTAGTLIDETFVDPYDNNYLLAVYANNIHHEADAPAGVSWLDLSSGDFFTQTTTVKMLPSLIARVSPREVVIDADLLKADHIRLRETLGEIASTAQPHVNSRSHMILTDWRSMLEQDIPPHTADALTECELGAGNLILDYVHDRLLDNKILLQAPIRKSEEDYMLIDKQSLRGLEIRATLREGGFCGSLLHTVRRTVTKGGARLLARRLVSPSMSIPEINSRLDLVGELKIHRSLHAALITLLQGASDVLRLLQRFTIGKGDADDLLALASTIDITEQITVLVHDHVLAQQDQALETHDVHDLDFIWNILGRFDIEGPRSVAKAIHSAIDEDNLWRQHAIADDKRAETEALSEKVVSADSSGENVGRVGRRASRTTIEVVDGEDGTDEVWVMRRNASTTLAKAHRDLASLITEKRELETRLRHQLKNESLTLRWSAQLGHFCHIKSRDSRNVLAVLPDARAVLSKATTCSFYLTDWSRLGVQIDDSKLRIRREEERMFEKLRDKVIGNIMKLRRNAVILDELDVACSSATLAREQRWVRPTVDSSMAHIIVGGRHPTVDNSRQRNGRTFVANDCSVGDKERIYYITGPNMAGKSTYLRQNALITILAQTGCFVPAEYAKIGLVDKIFSRVGSADDLYQDRSTFMVEMVETAEILRQATPRSFVIMDEVGRGTTPEDGVAVGYACLHHLHYVNKCRTLFATHFHALADMTADFGALARYCTDVSERDDGSWMYMHKLRPGVNRKSHALKVSMLAGMPAEAMAVAAQVLADFDEQSSSKVASRVERPVERLQASG